MSVIPTNVLFRYQTTKTEAVRDPALLYTEAARNGLPVDHWHGKPSTFRLPRGKEPGRGWVLLTRKFVFGDKTKNNVGSLDLTGTFGLDFVHDKTTLALSPLYIAGVKQLYADGIDSSNETLLLIELVDKRAILALSTINAWYNVLCPAPPAHGTGAEYSTTVALYYQGSLNGAVLWTWQTMLDDIWGQLPAAIAGASPPLPYSPHDIPREFSWLGQSAWEAYNAVLDKIGCVLTYNPIANTFAVVRTNAAQTLAVINTETDLLANQGPARGVTRYPATIRVFFPRRDEHHGTEKEMQRTTGNYLDTPAYSKDTATGLTGAVTGTVLSIWDEMPAIYTFAGTHLNATQCDARAAEIAANLKNKLLLADTGHRRLFRGLKSAVLCGAEIAEVIWRDTGSGMITEYRGNQESGVRSQESDKCGPIEEPLLPPDVTRPGFPVYPRLCHVVRIVGTGTVTRDADTWLWPGKAMRVDPEQNYRTGTPFVDDVDCWIMHADSAKETLPANERFVGRLVGTFNDDPAIYPLFVVQGGTGAAILWAVVQAGSTNGTGQTKRTFSVKTCDSDGLPAHGSGTAFNVVTPGLGAVSVCTKWTALFTDYVVGYQVEPDGEKVIVTDCWDVPFGRIQLVDDDTAISDGWVEYTTARDRFVLGHTAAIGYGGGPGGGPAWNAGHQLLHTHCAHADVAKLEGAGATIYPFAATGGGTHNDVDTCPPFTCLKYIKRTT